MQANGGLLGETFHETQQEGLAGPGTPASELFSMTIVLKISEDIFSLLLLPNSALLSTVILNLMLLINNDHDSEFDHIYVLKGTESPD